MEDGLVAWSALLRVHALLVPEFDRRLQATAGLPLTWYDLLLELNVAPQRRLTMGELGQRAVVSRTRVSRVVDELVRAALVTRETNPDDGRSSFAVITDEGRRRLRAAAPVYLEAIATAFSARFTANEARIIAAALTKVLATPLP